MLRIERLGNPVGKGTTFASEAHALTYLRESLQAYPHVKLDTVEDVAKLGFTLVDADA